MSSRLLIRLVLGGCFSLCIASSASAIHPYHASVAYVDVIARPQGTRRLEIALRVFPDDLENALREEFDDKLRLTSKKIDSVLEQWLSHSFLVELDRESPGEKESGSAKKPKPTAKTSIQWVGKEVNVKTAWLYFEIDVPKDKRFVLNNKVLFRQFEDQVNTVVVREGKKKRTLRFSPHSKTPASPNKTFPKQ